MNINKINNFWNDKVRDTIIQYIQTDDISIKNSLFNTVLYKPILYIIETSLLKRKCYSDDMIQSCLIHTYTKVLPKITLDRVVTSQSFTHRCINNHILDVIKKDNRTNLTISDEHISDEYKSFTNSLDYYYSYSFNTDVEERNNIIDNKIDIIRRLDAMVRQQRVVNKPNSIFLLLLKEYLLKNDFDAREFNKYVQQEMNITPMTYSIIASRLHIRTKILNEPFIKKMYEQAREIDR